MILNTESLVLLKKLPKNNNLKKVYDPIINTQFIPWAHASITEENIKNLVDIYYTPPKKKSMMSSLIGEIF